MAGDEKGGRIGPLFRLARLQTVSSTRWGWPFEVRLMLHAIKKGPFHEQETFAPSPEPGQTREPAPAVG